MPTEQSGSSIADLSFSFPTKTPPAEETSKYK